MTKENYRWWSGVPEGTYTFGPTDACQDPEPREMCDHICMKDAGHVERGESHFYGYENPSPRRPVPISKSAATDPHVEHRDALDGHTGALTGVQSATPRVLPVGQVDIATWLGVKPSTVETWRHRKIFPEPDGMISEFFPVWWPEKIEMWARETGRLK